MLSIVKSSQELDLSFDFEIKDKIERTLFINVKGLLRPIKWNENSFEWFLEDLVYYMTQQKYQQRWDVTNIELLNCRELNITRNNFEKMKMLMKQVVQWTIKLSY